MYNILYYSLAQMTASPPASLQFIGNGSENTTVYQSISLLPSTQYAVSFWAAIYGTTTAGVLEISLVDNFNNIIQDNSSVNNDFTVSHTSLTTTFAAFGGSFRTPTVMPLETRLRLKMSTAINSGGRFLIQTLAMYQQRQLYSGGPSICIFSGDKKLIYGDNFTISITNSQNGLIQSAFNRYFGMTGLNLVLPSSASPTIPDSLIPTSPPVEPGPPPIIP